MKKTQRIELFNNIKGTFKSFFSIMMFVALSIGIFAGISWTAPALQNSANAVFSEGNLYDFEILYPNGLTEEDIETLEAIEGVNQVEPGYLAYQTVKHGNGELIFKVMSVTEELNKASVIDGKLPDKKGEMALDVTCASANDIKVGDTFTFIKDDKDDDDGMALMRSDKYTVTAIVENPAFISNKEDTYGISSLGSGYVNGAAYVHSDSFDIDAYPGFPQVYISCDELDNTKGFSKKYDEISLELKKTLETIGAERSKHRYKTMKAKGDSEIKNAEEKLKQAEVMIADGERQIHDGRIAVEDGNREIAEKQSQLEEAKKQIDAAEKEYKAAEAEYKKLVQEYKNMQDIVNSGPDISGYIDEGKEVDEIPLDEDDYPPRESMVGTYSYFKDTIDEKYPILSDLYPDSEAASRAEMYYYIYSELETVGMLVEEAGATLEDKRDELDAAREAYNEGLAQLAEGKRRVAEGNALIASKQQELDEAKVEYDKGSEELDGYKKQFAELKDNEWTILSRGNNVGVMRVERFSDVTNNMRFSMAALFMIIGLLVSYSAVSRIVNDQKLYIGTKKALGMRSKEIIASYMAYSGSAVIIGSILGLVIGTQVIERILAGIIGKNYIMGPYAPHFDITEAAILVGFELAIILLTTWMACRGVLAKQAVVLLKGNSEVSGKERFFEKWILWQKLPLFTKTVINNCLNDKKRVFATIIGIAGCTALIVTAVTINDNLQKSFDRQYENVYHYDTIVQFDADKAKERQAIESKIEEVGAESTFVNRASFRLELPDESINAVTVTAAMEDDFSDFYNINNDISAGNEYADGIWVSRAYNEHIKADVGDKVKLIDSEGEKYEATIAGFFDYYLLSYQMVVDESSYETIFNKKCTANAMLVDTNGAGADAVDEALAADKNVKSVDNDYKMSFDTFDEFLQIAKSIILLYLVLSVLMAIVVLYDLYAVFIHEKRRELIIMMINGYSAKSAKQYIYRDTIVLTVIGIIAGIILGSLMGNITIISIEPDEGYFVKAIDWLACGVGAVVSAALAVILCKIALKAVDKFNLTDINRM